MMFPKVEFASDDLSSFEATCVLTLPASSMFAICDFVFFEMWIWDVFQLYFPQGGPGYCWAYFCPVNVAYLVQSGPNPYNFAMLAKCIQAIPISEDIVAI